MLCIVKTSTLIEEINKVSLQKYFIFQQLGVTQIFVSLQNS